MGEQSNDQQKDEATNEQRNGQTKEQTKECTEEWMKVDRFLKALKKSVMKTLQLIISKTFFWASEFVSCWFSVSLSYLTGGLPMIMYTIHSWFLIRKIDCAWWAGHSCWVGRAPCRGFRNRFGIRNVGCAWRLVRYFFQQMCKTISTFIYVCQRLLHKRTNSYARHK